MNRWQKAVQRAGQWLIRMAESPGERQLRRLFAEARRKRRQLQMEEIGANVSANSFRGTYGMYQDFEHYPPLRWPENIKVYDQMRRSDGQVQAVLLVLELPIRATRWYIEPGSEEDRDQEIADFVRKNLFEDMEHTWDDFLRKVLTMLPFGHAVFEKVYRIDQTDGMIKWQKFAERPQRTLVQFVPDENGDLREIHQFVQGKPGEIILPAEKCLVFSFREEGGDPRGQSILRAAYKHWKMKDFVYSVVNTGIEREYVGVPFALTNGEPPQDVLDDIDEALDGLTKGEKGWFRLPEAYVKEIGRWESQREQSKIMPYIEHHDLMIARSALAHFINLGSQGATGSWALSKDQSDLFLMSLNSIANYICDVINRHAIPELVRANFGDVEWMPTLAHDPVGGDDPTPLIDAVQKLLSSGAIKADEPLEVYLRERLKLPEIDPDRPDMYGVPPQEQQEQQSEQNPEEDPDPSGGPGDGEEPGEEEEEEEAQLAEGRRFWREPTQYEQRIQLAELEDLMDRSEDAFVEGGFQQVAEILEEYYPVIAQLIAQRDLVGLAALQINYQPLAEWIDEFLLSVLVEAVEGAAEELDLESVPGISPATMEEIRNAAWLAAASITTNILNRVKQDADRGLRGDRVEPNRLARQMMDTAKEQARRALRGQSSVLVQEAVNKGRELAGNASGARLAQFSAILDKRTCRLCRRLDGQIVRTDSESFKRFSPPLHHRCRCIWAYILPDEDPQPEPDWKDPPESLVEEHGSLLFDEKEEFNLRCLATWLQLERGDGIGKGSSSR